MPVADLGKKMQIWNIFIENGVFQSKKKVLAFQKIRRNLNFYEDKAFMNNSRGIIDFLPLK